MNQPVHTDERVDHFIHTLPACQREACQRIRNPIHETEPKIEETIKRSTRPYFVLQGNVYVLFRQPKII